MNPPKLPEGGINSRTILVWKDYKKVKIEFKSICNKAIALWSFFNSFFLGRGILYIFTAFKIPFLYKPKTLPLLALLQQKIRLPAHLPNTGLGYTVLLSPHTTTNNCGQSHGGLSMGNEIFCDRITLFQILSGLIKC